MIFSRSRVLPTLPPLKIFGSTVPRVTFTKFLGIIFDAKMTGKNHFQHLIHKSSVLIDILTSLSGTWWGLHPYLLLNLYHSIFRGSIEYGCQIFRFNRTKTIFSKLERLQFRAIRVGLSYVYSYQCYAFQS